MYELYSAVSMTAGLPMNIMGSSIHVYTAFNNNRELVHIGENNNVWMDGRSLYQGLVAKVPDTVLQMATKEPLHDIILL